MLEFRRATDEAAHAGERLGQRADHEHIVISAQGVKNGAAALLAQHAGAVRVIDVEDGIVPPSRLIQFGQRRQCTGHAVNAVDRYHGTSIGPG